MATRKTSVDKTTVSPVNWSLQAHQRVMAVWHVAAMSLGVEPKLDAIILAKGDKAFAAAFEERKQLLGRKLSTEPEENHVTFFPRHGYNASKTGYNNKMVDVVSCIKILKRIYPDLLPPEFLALEATLEQVALPRKLLPRSNLVVISAAVGAPTSEAEPKKSPTTRAASIEHRNLHVLLYAMACSGYEYRENMSNTEKLGVATAIAADVPELLRGRYGLGSGTILRILRAGAGLAKEAD